MPGPYPTPWTVVCSLFPFGVRFEQTPGAPNLFGKVLFVWEGCTVLRSHDLVGQAIKSIMGHGLVFVSAEDQSHGRVFIFQGPVLPGVVEVEVHLARIGVGELAQLEVDDHLGTQAAVEEEQIHPVPGIADAQAALSRNSRRADR